MISICLPVYDGMPDGDKFLKRCIASIEQQTFKDYEVVITADGKWAENHNSAIRKAKGDLIKFLHMDDWFSDPEALQRIADGFKEGWLITACSNNPHPFWTDDIYKGNNRLGGPSCLTIENKDPLLFDEELTWMVDVDYYQRLYRRYGEPDIIDTVCVNIGIHPGQATNLISDSIKTKEHYLVRKRYE